MARPCWAPAKRCDGSFIVALTTPQTDGEVLQVRASDANGASPAATVTPPDLLVANDDVATLVLEVTPQILPQPLQDVSLGGVLDLGLVGDLAEVSLLSSAGRALVFEVPENATRQVSVDASGAALTDLSLLFGDIDLDLLVYRAEPGSETATLVQRVDDWLEGTALIGTTWSAPELALETFDEGGTYYVTFGNEGGLVDVTLLSSLTLESTSDEISDYDPPASATGTVSGNVITGDGGEGTDTAPAGTTVLSVDGVTLAGPTAIEGDFGTLTIESDGSYEYTVAPDFAGGDGAQDVFAYTILGPDGDEETASLTVTLVIDGVGGDEDAASAAMLQAVLSDLAQVESPGTEAGSDFDSAMLAVSIDGASASLPTIYAHPDL